MIALLWLFLAVLASPLKSKCKLEAENVALRHQVIVLRRQARSRVRLTSFDRLFLVQHYRWFPSILKVFAIVQPETLIRWHRAGFRCYWRWKSRARGGRPLIVVSYSRLDHIWIFRQTILIIHFFPSLSGIQRYVFFVAPALSALRKHFALYQKH
jgi:hypothetical protein